MEFPYAGQIVFKISILDWEKYLKRGIYTRYRLYLTLIYVYRIWEWDTPFILFSPPSPAGLKLLDILYTNIRSLKSKVGVVWSLPGPVEVIQNFNTWENSRSYPVNAHCRRCEMVDETGWISKDVGDGRRGCVKACSDMCTNRLRTAVFNAWWGKPSRNVSLWYHMSLQHSD